MRPEKKIISCLRIVSVCLIQKVRERLWQTRWPGRCLGPFKDQSPLSTLRPCQLAQRLALSPVGSLSQIPVLFMPTSCQLSRYILHLCSYLCLASSPTFLPSLIICIWQFSDAWSKPRCQLLDCSFCELSRPILIEPVLQRLWNEILAI